LEGTQKKKKRGDTYGEGRDGGRHITWDKKNNKGKNVG